MFNTDLAELYEVSVKVLNQAIKRNRSPFPQGFMFQLTAEESDSLRSHFVTLKRGRGQHRKYHPFAFTEQGVAMQRFERSEAVERLERLERTDPVGERSEAVERLERALR